MNRDILSIGVGCLSSGLWLLSVTLFTFLHAHIFIYEIPEDRIDQYQDMMTRKEKYVFNFYDKTRRKKNKAENKSNKGTMTFLPVNTIPHKYIHVHTHLLIDVYGIYLLIVPLNKNISHEIYANFQIQCFTLYMDINETVAEVTRNYWNIISL
ncbi:hypothetical protein KSF78_0004646 [Schistosoma japonicum]|nr:hypothetical protein KSF78_0004646 [Schistosoma japonicum]